MEIVLKLMLVCSAMTSLITEALKTVLPDNGYSKNILAGIVSIFVSAAISTGYVILNNIPVTQDVIVYIITLVVLTWLCAMLGYDKVVQTIKQNFGKNKSDQDKEV